MGTGATVPPTQVVEYFGHHSPPPQLDFRCVLWHPFTGMEDGLVFSHSFELSIALFVPSLPRLFAKQSVLMVMKKVDGESIFISKEEDKN